MDDREHTPRQTPHRDGNPRRLSLLPQTFHECHRKNASRFTLYHKVYDTDDYQA